nr:MAG TPA: hypothetical protein [Caudoviricetes sp.]DAG67490.1 MAG TPA: hypothetical protein [Caudoviricetes sp.]
MTKLSKKDFVNGFAVIFSDFFLVFIAWNSCASLVH